MGIQNSRCQEGEYTLDGCPLHWIALLWETAAVYAKTAELIEMPFGGGNGSYGSKKTLDQGRTNPFAAARGDKMRPYTAAYKQCTHVPRTRSRDPRSRLRNEMSSERRRYDDDVTMTSLPAGGVSVTWSTNCSSHCSSVDLGLTCRQRQRQVIWSK